MKKSTKATKLSLNRQTLKLLETTELTPVAGGAPVTTIQLPCVELTARC